MEEKRPRESHLWNDLSNAGLTGSGPEDLATQIQKAKDAVMARLRELLDESSQTGECESAASALGTLTQLQRKLRPRP